MTRQIFSTYFKAYGGWSALFRSRYFWCAFFVTIVLTPEWSEPNWWERVLSVMPNMLGFSLGGFSLWLAIGDDKFREVITHSVNGRRSAYAGVNATFVHFILLQIAAIFCALLADAYNFQAPFLSHLSDTTRSIFYVICAFGSFVGYFLFIYALFSAIAATMALFRISGWYETYLNKNREKHRAE